MDLFKFTIVGSVHVVDYGLVPSWGPSTLWIYLSFLPLSGPSTLWTMILTLRGVRPLCGLKFFTLVRSVHVVDYGLDPSWCPSTSWTCLSLTLVGSVHVMDSGLDP